MNLLDGLVQMAMKGRLRPTIFNAALRQRRSYLPYLRRLLGQLESQLDRCGNAGCVGATVGFHNRAVQAQEHAAIHAARVDPFAKALQRRNCQH